jgi:hypothetical protein
VVIQGEAKNFGKADALTVAPQKKGEDGTQHFSLMLCGNCVF